MKGIDTNILVRFLVRDDEKQAKAVYSLFKNAESNKSELFVPLLVVLELIWVLESAYEIPRDDILDALRDLLLLPILKFEQPNILHKFIRSARHNKCDLADMLIALSDTAHDCETMWTLNKRAAKYEGFEYLKG